MPAARGRRPAVRKTGAVDPGLFQEGVVGFTICWHSLQITYVSSSVALEQSPAVEMAKTGDRPATILKYYAKLPKVVMRKFVENKPVIPSERV
jgi:hypothetical protein